VGANGVVGFGICRQLAGRVARLVMVGTDIARLERSADRLRRRLPDDGTVEVVVTTDLSYCREADMLFTATSAVDPVLYPEHVKRDAIIYDLGRPADVHPSVLGLPGVTLIPGGVVRPPGAMHQRLDTHFGEGQIPACMAETLLIALDECYDRVSLGDRTRSDNIDYFVEAAERYAFVVVDEAARPAETVRVSKVPVTA
jgi:predicted amino acid dehydrogenase